jgi:hypothetical protein
MKRAVPPLACFLAFFAYAQAAVFYFPHIVDGGGTSTVFYLSNQSEVVVTGTLNLYNSAGAPLSIGFLDGAHSSFALSLNPRSTIVLTAVGGSNPVAVGYAKLEVSQGDVLGMALLQYTDGREASVLAVRQGTRFALPVQRTSDVDTGIALCRTTYMPIRVTLYNNNGVELGARNYDFSGKKTAKFVSEILTLSSYFQGTLVLESESTFTAVGLRFGAKILSVPAVADFVSYATVFCPNGAAEASILNEINRAEGEIDIAVFSFASTTLADALIAAQNRGVAVRVLVDLGQGSAPGQQADRLAANGVAIRKVHGPGTAAIHHSFAVFDWRRVMVGSYDWAAVPQYGNHADLLFIEELDVVQMYEQQFGALWD